MKILCTGGAGYIGSILVPSLLQEGHLVTVLDNFEYNQSSLLDYVYSSNLEVIRGSVNDHNLMSKVLKDKEVVIPMACLTGAPLCDKDPLTAIDVIVHAIDDMLDILPIDTKIIYPTTNSGYGVGGSEYCTEESKLAPISLYGQLKCEAEEKILSRGNSCSLRLATAFGASPRMRLDLLVNDFVYRAVNDKFIVVFEGHFRRNYVHVRDIASAMLHVLHNWDTMKNDVYNVGNSTSNCTKIELCEKIKNYLPNLYYMGAAVGEDPDKRDYIVSNEKLEKTGWKAGFSLEEGIQELIKAYKIIRRNQYANV